MIVFKMNNEGKVTLYPYAITDGTNVVPCVTETQANNLLQNRRYEGYAIINSDEPTERLLEVLKGVRFDSLEDAELFINGGGYEECVLQRIEDLELVMAEIIGG